MKLTAITIQNFRGYKDSVRIPTDDLTAFIGRNDAGKSTILEALDLFFNDEKPERDDACVYSEDKTIRIGCVFADLPDRLILDAMSQTSFKAEYLLNSQGELEILKEWDTTPKTPKESVYALAMHPTSENAADLLSLKQTDLKNRIKKLSIDESKVKLSVNREMRQAIRDASEPLNLAMTKIPLDKEEAKAIWESIKTILPMFALFKSDRASHDADDEVQSPMKFAITQALKELEPQLKAIEEFVHQRANDVAERTLSKLKEMDSKLANELKPFFKADPKWDVFKFGLVGDNDIPVNKRGSGVRRLILLNFFRAEAERRKQVKGGGNVIYAIEEPETSQHPNNQKMLVQSLQELARNGGTQVLVTSHTPHLAGLLPSDSLRYVYKKEDGTTDVKSCVDADLIIIANELGVLPDQRVKALVFVEGINDIEFFERICPILKREHHDIVDFTTDSRVALVPLGGGNLKHWVAKHYLSRLNLPEAHIYDRDDDVPPKYQAACNTVNARGDQSWAVITLKRELENYLHADAIHAGLGHAITFTDDCDVPAIVAKAIHESSASQKTWAEIIDKDLSDKVSRAKKRLNSDAVSKMTCEMYRATDPNGELVGWLRRINGMLQ